MASVLHLLLLWMGSCQATTLAQRMETEMAMEMEVATVMGKHLLTRLRTLLHSLNAWNDTLEQKDLVQINTVVASAETLFKKRPSN